MIANISTDEIKTAVVILLITAVFIGAISKPYKEP